MPARPATALICALLAATGALASNETIFAPDHDGTVSFNLPSLNIGCTYIPAEGTVVYRTRAGTAELHCTRVEPEYLVVILEAEAANPRPIRAGEAPGLPMAAVLDYGRFFQEGPFTCLSARAGLVCTNATGAGLRMARREVVTW